MGQCINSDEKNASTSTNDTQVQSCPEVVEPVLVSVKPPPARRELNIKSVSAPYRYKYGEMPVHHVEYVAFGYTRRQSSYMPQSLQQIIANYVRFDLLDVNNWRDKHIKFRNGFRYEFINAIICGHEFIADDVDDNLFFIHCYGNMKIKSSMSIITQKQSYPDFYDDKPGKLQLIVDGELSFHHGARLSTNHVPAWHSLDARDCTARHKKYGGIIDIQCGSMRTMQTYFYAIGNEYGGTININIMNNLRLNRGTYVWACACHKDRDFKGRIGGNINMNVGGEIIFAKDEYRKDEQHKHAGCIQFDIAGVMSHNNLDCEHGSIDICIAKTDQQSVEQYLTGITPISLKYRKDRNQTARLIGKGGTNTT